MHRGRACWWSFVSMPGVTATPCYCSRRDDNELMGESTKMRKRKLVERRCTRCYIRELVHHCLCLDPQHKHRPPVTMKRKRRATWFAGSVSLADICAGDHRFGIWLPKSGSPETIDTSSPIKRQKKTPIRIGPVYSLLRGGTLTFRLVWKIFPLAYLLKSALASWGKLDCMSGYGHKENICLEIAPILEQQVCYSGYPISGVFFFFFSDHEPLLPLVAELSLAVFAFQAT